MKPRKRDSAGRRLAVDITPLEAVEAASLRLEAEGTGWIVTPEIEQRPGYRPCAHGWQFRLKVPIGEGWTWVQISTWYEFYYWTAGGSTRASKLRARQRITEWEEAAAA